MPDERGQRPDDRSGNSERWDGVVEPQVVGQAQSCHRHFPAAVAEMLVVQPNQRLPRPIRHLDAGVVPDQATGGANAGIELVVLIAGQGRVEAAQPLEHESRNEAGKGRVRRTHHCAVVLDAAAHTERTGRGRGDGPAPWRSSHLPYPRAHVGRPGDVGSGLHPIEVFVGQPAVRADYGQTLAASLTRDHIETRAHQPGFVRVDLDIEPDGEYDRVDRRVRSVGYQDLEAIARVRLARQRCQTLDQLLRLIANRQQDGDEGATGRCRGPHVLGLLTGPDVRVRGSSTSSLRG
jgi:hypothetical protein